MSYRLHRTLSELEATLTLDDYLIYCVEESIEPRGEGRADLRAGIVAAAAVSPYVKKGRQMPKPSDFIPRFGSSRPRPQDPASLKLAFHQWVVQSGGIVHPPEKG